MLRILNLEDNELDGELTQTALADQGIEHEWHWASSRTSFVAILHKLPVDVVLCDSIGPSFYGIEVMSLVRRQQPQAAFIFLTGHSELSALEALQKAGADGVLFKGNLKAIGETITSAITKRKTETGA